MKISEVIKELQERLYLYGDVELVFRDMDDDFGTHVSSVYFDEDENMCVISNFVIPDWAK